MNSKQRKEDKQLSLMLDFPLQTTQVVLPIVESMVPLPRTTKVIAFSVYQTHTLSFRERVIQDLIRTRVMVED